VAEKERPWVLVGVTGGIAAYKIADVVRGLYKADTQPICLMTPEAEKFITVVTLQTLSRFNVYNSIWVEGSGFRVDHVSLAANAKAMLIAPATMHMIGKLASGLADDIVSLTAQSFEGKKLIAPAMNSRLWRNPITQRNLNTLREVGYEVIDPEEGPLACGEEGIGRLAAVETLVARTLSAIKK
jgi:phosphopantothenoylcysteine decarboxylase / phosphopantothenate---cysteine ligase